MRRGKRISPRICRHTIYLWNHSLSRSKYLKPATISVPSARLIRAQDEHCSRGSPRAAESTSSTRVLRAPLSPGAPVSGSVAHSKLREITRRCDGYGSLLIDDSGVGQRDPDIVVLRRGHLEGIEFHGHALNAPLEEVERGTAHKSCPVDASFCVNATGFPFKTTAGRPSHYVHE